MKCIQNCGGRTFLPPTLWTLSFKTQDTNPMANWILLPSVFFLRNAQVSTKRSTEMMSTAGIIGSFCMWYVQPFYLQYWCIFLLMTFFFLLTYIIRMLKNIWNKNKLFIQIPLSTQNMTELISIYKITVQLNLCDHFTHVKWSARSDPWYYFQSLLTTVESCPLT